MSRIVLLFSILTLVAHLAAQPSRIAGVVLDADSRVPLAGANVVIEEAGIGTSADKEGEFLLSYPSGGTFTLRATYVGYAAVEQTMTIAPGDSVYVILMLEPEHMESGLVVVTGTRTLRSIADVPVRVEAIPEEEVEEKLLMTPSSVAMLLNESLGMRVQTTSAAASTANLRIQGLSGRYTQILNDGVPSLGGLSAGLSLTQLVPLDLRQVEILKGATSSLYGADAIAGVVNFIPKVPGEIVETSLLLNTTTRKGFDAATYTSHRLDKTGVSVLASYNRQSRFDADKDGFADVAQFTRYTVTPRVRHEFSEGLAARMTLGIMDEKRKGGAMNETILPGSPLPPYTEIINTTRFEISTHLDWIPEEHRAFSLKFAMLAVDRDATFGTSPFNARQHVYFGDAQYSLDLAKHNLMIGAAFRMDDFNERTPGITPRSYRFSAPSLFVQDEFAIADDLSLLFGGRIDFHDTFGTFFVPRLSMMYRPHHSLTLRVGGGTGYKAPTIFVEEAEEAGFRNVRPLTHTRPEKARSASFDVNWRGILGNITLDCNAAAFLTRLDDALLADEDSLNAGVVFLRNANGATQSAGGELSARLTYGHLKLSLGYTYLYATQGDNGHRSEIELNPRHSFGIVAIWEDHEGQLKMGLENYWTGEQRLTRNPFRSTSPAYWITGFIAEKGFGNFRLFINLENIFDTRQTRYEPVVLGDVASGTIRTLSVYAPLEGRCINGGIRYVFKVGGDIH